VPSPVAILDEIAQGKAIDSEVAIQVLIGINHHWPTDYECDQYDQNQGQAGCECRPFEHRFSLDLLMG
jgi:hypothetical protein